MGNLLPLVMAVGVEVAVQVTIQHLEVQALVDKDGFASFGLAPAHSPVKLVNKFKWKKNETAITNRNSKSTSWLLGHTPLSRGLSTDCRNARSR
jgi:hypothetical protein